MAVEEWVVVVAWIGAEVDSEEAWIEDEEDQVVTEEVVDEEDQEVQTGLGLEETGTVDGIGLIKALGQQLTLIM